MRPAGGGYKAIANQVDGRFGYVTSACFAASAIQVRVQFPCGWLLIDARNRKLGYSRNIDRAVRGSTQCLSSANNVPARQADGLCGASMAGMCASPLIACL
jgi:hypothetical protein